MSSDFVHLHNHSDAGSVLDGFGKLAEYVNQVSSMKQKGLGITDHGSVASIYSLIKKAKEKDITPIPGCEFYLAPQNPEGAKVSRPVYYGPNGQRATEYDVSSNGSYTHQTVWAVTNEGLSNLFKLSTLSNDPEHFYSKPRIDFNMLAEHSAGLVVASGCPSSEISTRLLMGQDKEAYEYAGRMKELFGENFFIEIMEHGMSIDLERKLLPKLMRMSKKMGVPLLATNDAHYTKADDDLHHEEMLCSQSGSRMSDNTWEEGGSRFAFNGNQYYLKSSEEMAQVFPDKDFPNALSNTLLIAEMAQGISMDYDPSLKPHAVLPKGHTEETYFRELVTVGLKERYGNASPEVRMEAKRRAEIEFEVIHSSNFIGYFLTVYEYINWTRDLYSVRDNNDDILALSIGVGRGSVGGSIIAFLLKISEIDPIKHDLLFERFLSAGRGDIYEITYDDGTTERVVVSEKRNVAGKDRYIHELNVGDEVTLDDSAATSSDAEEVGEGYEPDEPPVCHIEANKASDEDSDDIDLEIDTDTGTDVGTSVDADLGANVAPVREMFTPPPAREKTFVKLYHFDKTELSELADIPF